MEPDMHDIPTTRAAHIVEVCGIMRAIGTPVERELARAGLPTLIEEIPDAIVSNLRSLEFGAACADLEGIEDLGWLAAKRYSSSQLSAELTGALNSEVTVKTRLEKLFELCKLEDSHYDVRFGAINGSAEVIGDVLLPNSLAGMAASEWVQIMVLLDTVKSVTGPNWCPEKITFQNTFRISQEAREAFPNTIFEMGARHTSISFPTSFLACFTGQSRQDAIPAGSGDEAGLQQLHSLLSPYLREANFSVTEAGDLFGMSSRQFQRHLNQLGTSYSKLVDNIRFEMASDLLKDPDMRILDVALAVGFEDQSNFGRAFRRVSGISPNEYRRTVLVAD